MTSNFLNSFSDKIANAKAALANALLGTTETISTNGNKYPFEIQQYLDTLENQPYMKDLLYQPKETGLNLEQYKDGIAQGLNFGVPEIAQEQQRLGINIPKTENEIELAKTGDFNLYPFQGGLQGGPRQGGFLNDFSNGYKENYNNSFHLDNLEPQNKNFATKAGEFLGSVGRFIDSPLGRGLIAGGLNSALGYDDSLQEGLTAMVGRQNAQTQDALYRKSLIDNYGYNADDLSGIKGNITKDVFKNLADSSYKTQKLNQQMIIAQMKDNTSRARMIGAWLKNGQITPQEANILAATYGITDADFQASDSTRMTDSKIALNDARIDSIKNPKPKIYKTIKEGKVVVEHIGGGKNEGKSNANNGKPIGAGNSGLVRVKAPDGTIKLIPQSAISAAVANGGEVL